MFKRILKTTAGFLMIFTFSTGTIGIIIIIIPILKIIDLIAGENPLRLQKATRMAYKFWLFFFIVLRLIKCRVKGEIPKGPAVIIANHPGFFDVVFLMRDVPGITMLVKNSIALRYSFGPIIKMAGYIQNTGLDTGNASKMIKKIEKNIKSGMKFLIFPEGTRSPEGELRHFKTGAFKIARNLGVPIIPVVIRCDPPFLPKGKPLYMPPVNMSQMELEFLKPMEIPKNISIKKFTLEIEQMYLKLLNIKTVK